MKTSKACYRSCRHVIIPSNMQTHRWPCEHCNMFLTSIFHLSDVTNCFLIDGFPRNKDNLDGWQRQMSAKTDVKFTLFFDCTEEICTERCLQRGMAGSGR